MKKYFRPRFAFTVLTLFLTLCLVGLGVWQLHRAEEKKAWLALAHQQGKKPVLTWRPGLPLPQPFQRIALHGRYLAYTFFLDNQHAQHQWGYDVLSPLLLTSGEVVMVDRGWVLGDLQRKVLPQIEIPQGTLFVPGQVYYPSAKGLVLGEIFESHGASSGVIERLDVKLISNVLHKKVYPFIMRLNKGAVGAYICEWPVVSFPPERHQAYAVQWFAMALVLFIIFISLSFRKEK